MCRLNRDGGTIWKKQIKSSHKWVFEKRQRSWELLDCLHNLDPDWSWKNLQNTHRHTCKWGPIIISPFIPVAPPLSFTLSSFFLLHFLKKPSHPCSPVFPLRPSSVHPSCLEWPSIFSCFRTSYCRSTPLHGLVLVIPSTLQLAKKPKRGHKKQGHSLKHVIASTPSKPCFCSVALF